MPDFTYTDNQDGTFTIYPENSQAAAEWGKIAGFAAGSGRLFDLDLPNIKQQLKKAGYTLHKRALSKGTDKTDLELLEQLGA